MQSLRFLFNFILRLEKPEFKANLPNWTPSSSSKSCSTRKYSALISRNERKKCQEARGVDFIPIPTTDSLRPGVGYQSLLPWSPLHPKRARIHRPKRSQNRSYLGLTFCVSMKYPPNSIPSTVSWRQLFRIKIEKSRVPLRACLHFPCYVQQTHKKDFYWFPKL